MRRVSLARFSHSLMLLLALIVAASNPAWSAPAPAATAQAAADAPALDETATVDQLSDRLDQIRQGVTSDANDDLLAQLRMAAVQVQRQADALSTQRAADAQKVDDQLKVIGPAQPD